MKLLRGWSRVVIGALVALGLVALALGLGARAVAAQDTTVAIVDFAFEPATVTISAGSTVTWTNNGAAPHTATSDSGAFDSGTLQPGASFSQTFDTAGTFSYFCAIHPSMTGTITVTEAAAAQAAATEAAPAATEAVPAATAAPATGAQQVTQVPSTGTGSTSHGSGAVALLVTLAAASLGLATRVGFRRG